MTTEKQTYQSPAMQVIQLETGPLLHRVSGTGDYGDISYGGNGEGEYGD